MSTTMNFTPGQIAKKIVDYCRRTNRRFVFISGNGGSGKSELSKVIVAEASKFGHVNTLDMDDFVVDTALRKSASITWNDKDKGVQSGRYSTSFAASYFLQNIRAIVHNISCGNNYCHWPKKAKSASECRLLHSDAVLTVVEGIGTVFLERDKDNSLGLFIRCEKEIEIERRLKRKQFSNEQNLADILKNYEERNSQFEANILPYMNDYQVVLESLIDYSLDVLRDDAGLLL